MYSPTNSLGSFFSSSGTWKGNRKGRRGTERERAIHLISNPRIDITNAPFQKRQVWPFVRMSHLYLKCTYTVYGILRRNKTTNKMPLEQIQALQQERNSSTASKLCCLLCQHCGHNTGSVQRNSTVHRHRIIVVKLLYKRNKRTVIYMDKTQWREGGREGTYGYTLNRILHFPPQSALC